MEEIAIVVYIFVRVNVHERKVLFSILSFVLPKSIQDTFSMYNIPIIQIEQASPLNFLLIPGPSPEGKV